ncbi:hypothetical protein CY35_13G015400 [Sphagnum magellanicum]|nr:hypothetical protein CY35_13G015400 [Sphagnum magellanicum]
MKNSKRVAIVTGSNTGIGRETALSLARDGMKVFLACRSVDKAHEAATYIRESSKGADVDILLLDLRTLESVRKCAADFKSHNLPLHLLVNNAGVALGTPWYTSEGVGGSAQVNYLGPYVLTRLLEDKLVAGAPSRVVNVSSAMHRRARIDNPEKFLREFKEGDYSQAKLANVLFTFELQRRWQGKGVQACAVDPGAVASDIWRRSLFNQKPWKWLVKLLFAPTWDGAIPVVHAATTPLDDTQKDTQLRLFARGGFAWPVAVQPRPSTFFGMCGAALDWPIRNLSRGWLLSEVKEVPANPIAYDTNLASKLWTLSADIANLPVE